MIYYSKEARQSALTRLQELRATLARIPGDVLSNTDATDAINYLCVLSAAIRAEQRSAHAKALDRVLDRYKQTQKEGANKQ